jgi:hypothetical protein
MYADDGLGVQQLMPTVLAIGGRQLMWRYPRASQPPVVYNVLQR